MSHIVSSERTSRLPACCTACYFISDSDRRSLTATVVLPTRCECHCSCDKAHTKLKVASNVLLWSNVLIGEQHILCLLVVLFFADESGRHISKFLKMWWYAHDMIMIWFCQSASMSIIGLYVSNAFQSRKNGDRQGRHESCCQVCMMIDCWWLINVWLNEKTKLRIAVTKHNQSQSKKIQPDIITCQDIRTANEWVCSWFSVLFGVMLAVDCENATWKW